MVSTAAFSPSREIPQEGGIAVVTNCGLVHTAGKNYSPYINWIQNILLLITNGKGLSSEM